MKRKTVKDERVDKVCQNFKAMVRLAQEMAGFTEMREIDQRIELLEQEVNRYQFENTRGDTGKNRLNDARKRFITIFKARYLQLTDYEYPRMVTPAEGKMVGQMVKWLAEKNFEEDEYLAWFFDTFIEDNDRFAPPTVKLSCSGFVVDKFLYVHREKMKERRQEELAQKEMADLFNRARAVIRSAKEDGLKERVKEMLLAARDGRIMREQIRVQVQNFEKENESSGN